jgi:hypothetical protein
MSRGLPCASKACLSSTAQKVCVKDVRSIAQLPLAHVIPAGHASGRPTCLVFLLNVCVAAAQTDMWIRIAEAIDKDAVNDPALPPVPDEIADEAQRAKAEQDLERGAQQSYYAGQQNDTPFGFFAPRTETLNYVLLPVEH